MLARLYNLEINQALILARRRTHLRGRGTDAAKNSGFVLVAFASIGRHLDVLTAYSWECYPDSPEVLVLYRKRADCTKLRNSRHSARRAFDTAT
jgi:hypothetical protein